MAKTDSPFPKRGPVRLILVAVFVALAGCGGPSRPPVYPVRGQLFWSGKPAAGAVVFFHPIEDAAPTNTAPAEVRRPVGRVGDDGSFEMSTYGTKDGAPAGRYRLSLIWVKSKGPDSGEEVDVLPPEYANPSTAQLPIVEVRAEENVLPPLRLSK